MDIEELTKRYADIAIQVGVNLQPGQDLWVEGLIDHAPLARVIANRAYEAGARHVAVFYSDQHVRKAMLEHADEEVLTWTPPYRLQQLEYHVSKGGSVIYISGDPEPELLAGLDPARVGMAKQLDYQDLYLKYLNDRAFSWAIISYPNPGWATTVFGDPDVDKLWDAVARATRLYDEDPVASWWEHVDRLGKRADALNARGFDAIRYRGPGTDLTVGLIDGSTWMSARFETAAGIRHVPNLPTEEVFTSPDYRRVEGTVRSSRPLHLPNEGVTVTDLEMTFEGGRAVSVSASTGAEVVKAQMAIDEGGARLGEIALVDEASAVGKTGVTFGNTLFDENAACHLAYGAGFAFCVDGASELSIEEQLAMGLNHSKVHTDFMIGGPELEVSGVSAAGEETPIITGDVWQLPL
jgi:aminopeptidase